MTFNFSDISMQFLLDTIIYATSKHAGQVRRDSNLPYVVHPLRVLKTLMYETEYAALSEETRLIVAQAAILHDVVEDCDVSLREIADTFSLHVASLVNELTTPDTIDTAEKKTAYLKDKLGKLTHLALLIKLSDRLDNLDDYLASAKAGLPVERAVRYAQSTQEIMSHNAKAAKRHSNLASLIDQRVSQLLAFEDKK